MYKTLRKHQNTFFTCHQEALSFFKGTFDLETNEHGLHILKIDGRFKASFTEDDKADAILFYANQQVQRNLKQR